MRIISQNGLLDVPYELIAFSPYSGNMATIVGTFPGNDLGKGDKLKARYPEGFDVERANHRAKGDV